MMIRKYGLAAIALVSLAVGPFAAGAAATVRIDQSKLDLSLEVLVDARRMAFPDQGPVNKDGRVLVPLRFVSDKLGGKLTLEGKDITIVKDDRTVKLTIDTKVATANEAIIALDVPANVLNGRTMVPLRFISEALGEPVEWDALNQYVWIGSKDVPDIKDVVELEDIEKFKPYAQGYSGDILFKSIRNKPFTEAGVLRTQDFPVRIGEDIYYRIDRAMDTMGAEYIRLVSTETSSLGKPFNILQKGVVTKSRDEVKEIREDHDGIRVQYNNVVESNDYYFYKDKNYANLKLKDFDYLGIITDQDFAVFLKPDFLK